MNLRKTAALSVVALMVGVLGSNVAEARPGGRHFGGGGRAIFFAAPIIAASFFASRYYYPPSYYYPPAYYPPTYIEQPQYQQPQYQQPQYQQPQTQPQGQYQPDSQANEYYCEATRAYYPQVKSCSAGWQRVTPQSPSG